MLQTLALRWFRRYKLFFLVGLLIIGAQVFLAYKLLKIPIFGITDDDPMLSSKLYEKKTLNNLSTDDEDNQNSNIYSKNKDASRKFDKSLLNLDDLEFSPPCDISNRETVSAIHRAKSQECKALILEIACEIQKGTFYPKTLPNYCPNGKFIPERALGCFQDEKKFRILSGYYTNFKTANSPKRCIQMCLQSGFLYAGVQYSTECFCGNDAPKASAKLSDPNCNMKCPGDPKQACGGYFTINIYETGIAKFTPQTAEILSKDGEHPVKIAFLLTLNGRALRQVHRLLKALYSPQHFFYIHVDSRQDYLYRELLKLESNFSNIRLSRRRYSTIWGGASLLQMLLSSMEDLLQSGWKWDFVLNLSESDFPVKTLDKLVDFLSANKGKNFVKSHGREVQRFIQKQGLDKTFVECDTHMWRIGDRALPSGIQIDGGSDWIGFSRDFVRYVTKNNDKDDLLVGLLKIFKQTLLPAESFFHTVLRNSKFCHTYIDNNLHVTNWKRRLGCKCQYKHVVDWCGCSPNDFKPEDWPRLQVTEAKHLYFARKFEPIINQAVILQLEEWLYGPYPADYPNLNAYWQSLYHVDDKSPVEDGAILNVGYSVLRINSKSNPVQFYEPVRIIEITNYLEYDSYRGFLIHHEAYIDGHLIELETWCQPNVTAQVSKTSNFSKRIAMFEVSTNFDPKEQISRNFAKIIGSISEPVLIFRLIGSKSEKNTTNYNLTVVWIDPNGEVADVSDVIVDDPSQAESQIYSSKAAIKHNLTPGVWTTKLIYKKTLIGLCKFLVTSSTNQPPLPTNHIHPPAFPINLTLTKDISNLNLNNIDDAESALVDTVRPSINNNQPQPNNLLDNLIFNYFTIKDTCLVQSHNHNFLVKSVVQKFKDCVTTNWSSKAPDPKSDIYLELK